MSTMEALPAQEQDQPNIRPQLAVIAGGLAVEAKYKPENWIITPVDQLDDILYVQNQLIFST